MLPDDYPSELAGGEIWTCHAPILERRRVVDLTHARHDSAHVLSAIFRALRSDMDVHTRLDVEFVLPDRHSVAFVGPYALTEKSLLVMQAILALAGPRDRSRWLTVAVAGASAVELRDRLGLKLDWSGSDVLVVRTSLREIARAVGLSTGGPTLRLIQRELRRLGATTVEMLRPAMRGGGPAGLTMAQSRLLAWGVTQSGAVYVALNPRLTEAIAGRGQHVRLSLREIRRLRSAASRLIHQRLAGWIRHGETRRVAVDTLAGYVWPGQPKSSSGVRMRRLRVRKALDELVAVGWKVDEAAGRRGVYEITRPRPRAEGRDGRHLQRPAQRAAIAAG